MLDDEGEGDALQGVQYLAFGLGNTTYGKYNFMVRSVDERLEKLGASSIGSIGQGDDGTGTLDEDFLKWRDEVLTELSNILGAEKQIGTLLSPYNVQKMLDLISTPQKSILLSATNHSSRI